MASINNREIFKVLTTATGGTASLEIITTGDTTSHYGEIIVMGDATTTTMFNLNGVDDIELAGGTKLNVAKITNLLVTAGVGLLVKGYWLSNRINL